MTKLQRGRYSSIDAMAQDFSRRVLKRCSDERLREIREPAYDEMKAVPAAKAFLSQLKSEPILRTVKRTYGDIARDERDVLEAAHLPANTELPDGFAGLVYQKSILILDQNNRALGAIRWIRGEGEPFFISSFAKAERIDCILGDVPVPPEPVESKSRAPKYGVHLFKGGKGGYFRVVETRTSLQTTVEALSKVAPTTSFWALRERFDALKSISEARDFIAKFRNTVINYELAGRIENGRMAEAAVYVLAGSDNPVAVMRYVRGQGMLFFQNLLSDVSQSVEAVLGSVKGAQPAPADGRTDSRNLFWMGLPQQSK